MLNLPGLSLDDNATESIKRAMTELAHISAYRYPWTSLETDLQNKKWESLPVLGYGSLVNPDSAMFTLGKETLSTSTPAVAFGVRRVFDYRMTKIVERYGPPRSERQNAALNIRPTGSFQDVVNGVRMEIAVTEIEAFRQREFGYDLLPVPCLDWEALDQKPTHVYVLCCPPEFGDVGKIGASELLPHARYYDVCREGAARFGLDFLRLWLASTYLADNTTLVGDWEPG